MQNPIKYRRILFILSIVGVVLILIKALWNEEIEPSADFCAFYSTIDSSDFDILQSNNSEEADIIVELGKENGRLVFKRSKNYLPCWETKYSKKYFDKDLYKNIGGLNLKSSSKVFMYSTALIAEKSENKTVIQLKHQIKNLSSNKGNSDSNTEFISEYYTIYNNGAIERRILIRNISPGGKNVPTDLIVKYYILTKKTIKNRKNKEYNKNSLTSVVSDNK